MLSSQSYLIELQHALEIRTDRSLLTEDTDLKCTAIFHRIGFSFELYLFA